MAGTDPFGLVDQLLDEQFRVDKFVGEGGFSLVYKGLHLGLEEAIAIKCLKLPKVMGTAMVDSFVRRFREESRLHYRLSQGNLHIARTIASGTTLAPATGALVPYMVLEWLDGRSLAADFEVRRAYGDRGRRLEDMVKLIDSAAEALAFAHSIGVAHRDVNPGNIFLAETREGVTAKVLDFGVAKVMRDEVLSLGPRAQTVGSMRIFSPVYGAPEQFDDKLGPAGPWTDVYALALILVEGMRDQVVMTAENVGDIAVRAIDRSSRPTPRALGLSVSDEVEEVFVDALQVEPTLRFQDAGQFWSRLKSALRHARSDLPPSTRKDFTPPPPADAPSPPVPIHVNAAPLMPVVTQPLPARPAHGSHGGVKPSQVPPHVPTAPPPQVPLPAPGSISAAPFSPARQPSYPAYPPQVAQVAQVAPVALVAQPASAIPGAPSGARPPLPSYPAAPSGLTGPPGPLVPGYPPSAGYPAPPSSSLGPVSEEPRGSRVWTVVSIVLVIALVGAAGVIAWQLWLHFG
jgi:serine/threonine protein kinase